MIEENTYSVNLFFDKKSQSFLSNKIEEIALITKNNYRIEQNIPPHITIGMFKAGVEKLPKLIEKIKVFSEKINKDYFRFSGWNSFKGKTLFLVPDEIGRINLKNISHNLHSFVGADFKAGANNLYLPENYFPHLTICSGLSSSQMKIAVKYLEENNIDKWGSVKIEKISLAQHHPYKVIY